MEIDQTMMEKMLIFQRLELEGFHSYKKLSKSIKDRTNRDTILRIASEEMKHYDMWKKYTGRDVKPNMLRVNFYNFLSRTFGYTFGIKLMERGEDATLANYAPFKGIIPEIDEFLADETDHENTLIGMLDEESLQYAGSVVLGLNDALVELTGALAGLTLAFQNTRLIALSGLITGIAASLSMAASEFLSTHSEESQKSPVKAAVYTGIAYIITVALLILPYLIFQNYLVCLGITLATAVLIIAIFNYYISVARDMSLKRNFLVMAGLSLGVAALSFGIGYLIRTVLGIEV